MIRVALRCSRSRSRVIAAAFAFTTVISLPIRYATTASFPATTAFMSTGSLTPPPRRSVRLLSLKGSGGETDAPDEKLTKGKKGAATVRAGKKSAKKVAAKRSVKSKPAAATAKGTVKKVAPKASIAPKKTKGAKKSPKKSKVDGANDGVAAANKSDGTDAIACLPRTLEMRLKSEHASSPLAVASPSSSHILEVMGIDEAGRGPLAGPVVAAAAIVPTDIDGIVDSKKITKEERREELYEAIVSSPGVRWAVAIVSAERIDEINILQATLEGMRMAAAAIVDPPSREDEKGNFASVERKGSYVITGGDEKLSSAVVGVSGGGVSYHALIDGNKVPLEMPCPSEFAIKGDGREYAIGAASILAKVTRDRLMHGYDALYPEYNLRQHKGYPTQAHMSVVRQYGASPIHRRTFAPLKHMTFDDDGRIVDGGS